MKFNEPRLSQWFWTKNFEVLKFEQALIFEVTFAKFSSCIFLRKSNINSNFNEYIWLHFGLHNWSQYISENANYQLEVRICYFTDFTLRPFHIWWLIWEHCLPFTLLGFYYCVMGGSNGLGAVSTVSLLNTGTYITILICQCKTCNKWRVGLLN